MDSLTFFFAFFLSTTFGGYVARRLGEWCWFLVPVFVVFNILQPWTLIFTFAITGIVFYFHLKEGI